MNTQVKKRLSNLELLRIVAMLLVMVVHANYFSLGAPLLDDFQNSFSSSFTRVFFQFCSICCVNIFILISGYFGIRPKSSSLASFIYQIIFFFVFIYVVCIWTGFSNFNLQGFLQCVGLTSANWFIKAYLLLYILSPILNAFVETTSRRVHFLVLLGFYFVQSFYGCLFAADFFDYGYGTLSFIGLYLLARYIRIYSPSFTCLNKSIDVLVFLICSILITLITIVGLVLGKNFNALMFTYINPLVIVESITLLLFFSKLNVESRLINWIASSAFAAYLLHANPNILNSFFKVICYNIYTEYHGVVSLFYLSLFILLMFALAILIDQIRKLSYEFFYKKICNWRMESRNL